MPLAVFDGCSLRSHNGDEPDRFAVNTAMSEPTASVFEEIPAPNRSWKYPLIAQIPAGKALLITWSQIGNDTYDPSHAVRNIVLYYGKKLTRKFRTMKVAHGIYVIRDS